MRYKIYVIDDIAEQAKAIVDELNYIAESKNTAEAQFEFAFLPGTQQQQFMEKLHNFYDESIIGTIQGICETEQNEMVCIGLLLDILLSAEDMESSLNNYYPEAKISKKIYYTFCNSIPVYLITSFASFATQCEVIMGENLADKFITHNAILRYKIDADIDRLFDFYKKYEHA